MTSFPLAAARVPNLLQSRLMLSAITRGGVELARLQTQLATNKAINAPSDDAVKAAAIGVVNDRLERWAQLTRNLQHADSALSEADQALADASDTLIEAKQIASAQLNVTSSAEERASQAVIVDSLIASLVSISNRRSAAGAIFGGASTTGDPVAALASGYRFSSTGAGLYTDLGAGTPVPLTLGPGSLGAPEARFNGLATLEPTLHDDTRIADLRGGRGLGVTLGVIEMSVGGADPVEVDLRGADTIAQAGAIITAALRAYEADSGTTILDTGGVSHAGEALTLDIVAGGPSITFSEVGAGVTARDLGLASEDGTLAFDESSAAGLDLAPRLTWTTPLASIPALTLPLGSITLRNVGRAEQIDLSGASSLQDIRSAIESAGLGLKLEIDADNDRLAFVNQVASARAGGLSIEEVSAGSTASMLGIRTLDSGTLISTFNDGKGVSVVDGSTDPISGLPAPERDIDFTITLGDGAEIDIDLAPDDLGTVGDLLTAINTQIASALTSLGRPTTDLIARLPKAGGGLVLEQDPGISGPVSIDARNGSAAAEQLGLLAGTWDSSSATFAGEDRAKVRPLNAISRLLDLASALRGNDTLGITLAGEGLEGVLDRLAETRAQVGGHAQRIEQETRHIEDRTVFDEAARSQLQDLDFAQAASRFTLLQTQLQAGYQTAARLGQLSLINFLS
jgi:flagellar hook-associated protein 3 FlgL